LSGAPAAIAIALGQACAPFKLWRVQTKRGLAVLACRPALGFGSKLANGRSREITVLDQVLEETMIVFVRRGMSDIIACCCVIDQGFLFFFEK